jgi:outer membrane protein assembly factor BamB
MKSVLLSLLILAGCAQWKPEAPARQVDVFRVAWSKNLDPYYVSGNLPIGLGAPRIFRDMVFMGSMAGEMSAYDLETGRTIWSQQENTELGGPVEFFNDHVAYGGLNGRLYVRHYLTGKLKYAIDLASPIESAPVFMKDRLLIYLRGHQIVNLDAETGKILWVYRRAVPVTTTMQRTTQPLLVNDRVIVGFADGFVGALSLQEGTLLWENRIVETAKFVDVDLNPVLASGTVVTGSPSGELKAINPANGAVVRSYDLSVMAHPLLRSEQLVLGTNDGEVIIMGIDGSIIKRAKISTQPISAIAWWKNNIVAASFDGMLRAVDPLTMQVIGSFALGYEFSSVFSDLVVHQENLAVYSSRNRLYLFQ